MLGVGGGAVDGGDLVGGDGVAVGDVAARVEGVRDLELEAARGGLGQGPGVGDVVDALAVLDLGQVVGAGQEGRAVGRRQGRVADDGEGVPGSRRVSTGGEENSGAPAASAPVGAGSDHLHALGAVGDAVAGEVGDLVGLSLLLLQGGGRDGGGNSENGGELHLVGGVGVERKSWVDYIRSGWLVKLSLMNVVVMQRQKTCFSKEGISLYSARSL